MLSRRAKGYIITILGVLALSPDGLLTRFIHADSLTITFWRGLLFGITALLVVLLRYRQRIVDIFLSFGISEFGIMVSYSFGNLFFIYSITHTSVANTLFMISTTPIWAALISWVFLREPAPMRTWFAILAVIAGIAIISRGSMGDSDAWIGDIAGLLAAATLATQFSLIRHSRQADPMPALALGGVVLALLVSPFVDPESTSNANLFWLMVMGVFMLPIANTLLFLGPRYLPAPEVGLMMLLETVLGPVWVWLVIRENPGIYSIVGGAIVLITLAINTWLGLQEERSAMLSRTPIGRKISDDA